MDRGLAFFFSSRRRHTRCSRDWSSDVCSSDLEELGCAELEVRADQLLSDRGLALLDVPPADAVGGRLEEPVEAFPQTARLWKGLRAGRGDSVRGEPGLKVLSTACGAPHAADAEEQQENSPECDQREYSGR